MTAKAKHVCNILMLNYEFPPLGGGAANATSYLLHEFARYPDLKIDLVTSSTGKFNIERFADNITVHYLDINKNKNLHFQTNKDLVTYAYKAYLYSMRLKKQKHFELCHAFFGIPCGFIALQLGLPYIVSLRGSDVPFYNKRFYWSDKFLFKQLSKKIWSNANRVVANSEGLKELAQKTASGINIDIIYNGVDTLKFKPACNKAHSIKLRIISTGRLIERKGYHHLLEALKDNRQVELILIGDGNLSTELKELALKNNINAKFIGRVEHDSLLKYLHQADLFISPSISEGMSNAILEAMACGLPIVTTDTGGSEELINGNGFIVEKASPEALQKAVALYLKNKSLCQKHGVASRKLAEKMSWASSADLYQELYKTAIGRACSQLPLS